MKKVYYSRHAKSSWASVGLSDKQRPLNARGKRDAPIMSNILLSKLNAQNDSLDGILSSTSVRTRETLIPFAEIFQLQDKIIFDDALYHASSAQLIESLYQLPDNWSSCQVFAHNPGISELLYEIDNRDYENVPTMGIFKVQFDTNSWTDVDTNYAKVDFFIYPKLFTS